MHTGGNAATMSLNVAGPSRGGGIWIEQEKSVVTDVMEMRESSSGGLRTAHISSQPSVSVSRYDDEESSTCSEHSKSKIYAAI